MDLVPWPNPHPVGHTALCKPSPADNRPASYSRIEACTGRRPLEWWSLLIQYWGAFCTSVPAPLSCMSSWCAPVRQQQLAESEFLLLADSFHFSCLQLLQPEAGEGDPTQPRYPPPTLCLSFFQALGLCSSPGQFQQLGLSAWCETTCVTGRRKSPFPHSTHRGQVDNDPEKAQLF